MIADSSRMSVLNFCRVLVLWWWVVWEVVSGGLTDVKSKTRLGHENLDGEMCLPLE